MDTEIYGQKALEIYENLDKVSEHPECYPLKPLHIKFYDFELLQGVPQNSLRFLFRNYSAHDALRIFILDIFQQPFSLAVGNCPKF